MAADTPGPEPVSEADELAESTPLTPATEWSPGDGAETVFDWTGRYLSRAGAVVRRPHVAASLLVVLFAASLRFWDLGSRAMHHDESLHAYYSWFLAEQGLYQHNPLMHGTFQFVATSWVFRLLGDSDVTARLLPAIFGVLVVLAVMILFRKEMGRWGSILAGAAIGVSPGMLYFSRFARNDIYVILWTLLLGWAIWRYMESPRNRYIYIAAAVLALSFATKEIAYLQLLVFAVYLFVRALPGARRLFTTPLRSWPPAAALLITIVTIVLPVGGAALGLFQNQIGLNLTNPDPLHARESGILSASGPVGAPISQENGITSALFDGLSNLTGLDVVGLRALQDPAAPVLQLAGVHIQSLDLATATVVGLFIIGAIVGLRQRGRRWLIAAALFWSIFVFLFTTQFLNWPGFASGVWQSLGYWIAQQGVARGGQPWYYYPILLSTYEYLVVIVGFVAAGHYIRRRDGFGIFLSSWFILMFLFLTYAGEKMPWLSVHLTLPLALLAGRGLASYGNAIWDRRASFTPIRAFVQWGVLGGVALLGVATTQSAIRASFTNGDVPVEMLVYTQTSPSIAMTVDEIDNLAALSGEGLSFPISIDTMDGFGWPWYWYLRAYTNVEYRCFGDVTSCGATAQTLEEAPARGRVLILNSGNDLTDGGGLEAFGQGTRIPFRQWFPESAYRGPNYEEGLSVRAIMRGIVHGSTWGTMWDYWRTRVPPLPLGHVDVVVYLPRDYQPIYLDAAERGGDRLAVNPSGYL
ncbi:MAG: TIGR03663 family protein [Chloroflexi bacterium]|nr:TIGR03663 family protein [Chloroflexota bacterium]